MVHGNALNSYYKAQVYDGIDPKKLILMLYDGAIKRIVLAREGIKNADPKQRGENLGKAIAIISELHASLDEKNKTEEINFLRSLYAAMLVELPKVSVSEDVETLDRTEKYLTELKRIWVTTVMGTAPEVHQKNYDKTKKAVENSLNNYSQSKAYQSGSIAI